MKLVMSSFARFLCVIWTVFVTKVSARALVFMSLMPSVGPIAVVFCLHMIVIRITNIFFWSRLALLLSLAWKAT